MTRGKAKQLRALIERLAESLSDEDALTAPEMFPAWDETKTYAVGDRVRYGETLYKCLTAHTAQTSWTPEVAPSLWAEILPGQEGTEIGEWVQPDSTNTYKIGDRVYHNGKLWESDHPANSWEPGTPGVWHEVTE